MTPKQTLEYEIDKCFEELDEPVTLVQFLEQLKLPPLEEQAEQYYANNHGAAKHNPVAIVYTLLLYKLSDIKSRRATIRFLRKHPNITDALGHSRHGVPSPQVVSTFVNTKLDERADELIEYTVEYVQKRNESAEHQIKDLVGNDKEETDERGGVAEEAQIPRSFTVPAMACLSCHQLSTGQEREV